MIVSENQDPHNVKESPLPLFHGPALRRPDRILGTPSVSLPDYETSQAIELEARHLLRTGSTASTSTSSLSLRRAKRATLKEWLPSRFWRILFYTMIAYVVLTLAVGVPVIVLKVVREKSSLASQLPPTAASWLDEAPHNAPLWFENGVLVFSSNATCDRWTSRDQQISDNLFLSSASYELPATGSIATRLTAILSKTPSDLVSGNFDVGYHPDPKITQAWFNVTLHTSTTALRRNTHVCFQDAGSDRGVIVYAPTNITDISDMNVEIRLLLPRSSFVQKLATYLPGLDQTFEALDYSFDQVNVEGARSDMTFRSLRADKLFIKNALGPINGVFNVTNSLHLDNIGGIIDVNTTLVHDSSHDSATFMSIDNGNADVRAKVTLSSPQKHSILPTPKPRFTVNVKTFDEPIFLDILYDPTTAVAPLSLAVQNNLGDVNVTVDAKYEGTFDAATKLDKTTIVQTPVGSWYDPASLGRTFRYEYDYKSTNRAFGWVGWGGRVKLREDILSNIAVMSAMNPVSLSFREAYSQSTTRTRR